MQGGFYLTPIIYSITLVPVTLQKIIMLNPMSQAIQDARYSVIWHGTQTTSDIFDGSLYALTPYLIVIVTFIFGVIYFKKRSRYFAEDI
jgi:ABC-2 type transport system permease protein